MACLYISEQGAVLRKTGERVIIQKKKEVLGDIPCLKLDTILLFGNVQVTSQALCKMLDQGIELALFTLSGRLRGQLTPPKAKNIPLRMRQYEISQDSEAALAMAKTVVCAKARNAAAVLRRYRNHHPDAFSLEDIRTVDDALLRASQATSLSELLGVEGTAAARYFRALAAMVPPEAGFAGRNRRPPRDPMNALLSFGYVLVGSELQSLLDGMGFDPYLGFYHQVDYGRPSLALDLLEEFRAPLVDRFSANLLNLGTLQAADFVGTPEKGVLLQQEALKKYFRLYEKEMNTPVALGGGEELTFRALFRRQAERLARALLQNEPYESFQWPS
jgi:CRISPR-associated protein Cas1